MTYPLNMESRKTVLQPNPQTFPNDTKDHLYFQKERPFRCQKLAETILETADKFFYSLLAFFPDFCLLRCYYISYNLMMSYHIHHSMHTIEKKKDSGFMLHM